MTARCLSLLTVVVLGLGSLQGHSRSRTEFYVKTSVTVDKPNAKGEQHVKLTVVVDDKCHLYGHHLPQELLPAAFRVRFLVDNKPINSVTMYPKGETVKLENLDEYQVYRGTVVINSEVARPAGSKVEMEIGMFGHLRDICLLPSRVRLTVPTE